MTRVYVDVAATSIDGDGNAVSLDPLAVRSLALLAAADHEVLLVSDQAAPAALREVATGVVQDVPASPPSPAWYLTADVGRCHGASARLRTVLVGAAPPAGSIHRCDSVARDVQAAVFEVLASEAMPPGR